MNRRNFFSLAALSFGGLLARRVERHIAYTNRRSPAASQLDLARRDCNAWAEKYRGLLTPEQKRQDDMLQGACHSHSINDPSHSHNRVNPNWVYHNWPQAPHG